MPRRAVISRLQTTLLAPGISPILEQMFHMRGTTQVPNGHGLTACRTFLLGLMVACLSLRANAQATPSQLPNDFDPKKIYTEYTYEDLNDYVAEALNITNAFVGKKVKFLAETWYGSMEENTFSHAEKYPDKFDYRCRSSLCDKMMQVNFPFLAKARFNYKAKIFLYLSDATAWDIFARNIDRDCKELCYLAVAGTLGVVDGEEKPVFRPWRKTQFAYVQVKDIRVYPANENKAVRIALGLGKAVVLVHNMVDPILGPILNPK
jgi:hypothetical protein